jgi:hypothetical protein
MALIPTLIIIAFMIFLVVSTTWLVHISMVKGEDCDYGKGDFKAFKREFDKYNWSNDGFFENSLFDYHNGSKLHASIYKFNHKGMIMNNPIEYFKSVIHIRRYCKKHFKPKKNIVDWNK